MRTSQSSGFKFPMSKMLAKILSNGTKMFTLFAFWVLSGNKLVYT